MAKSKEPKTHFDQIPLEIVKKIAEEEFPDEETNGAYPTADPPAKKCSAFTRFRSAAVNAQRHITFDLHEAATESGRTSTDRDGTLQARFQPAGP